MPNVGLPELFMLLIILGVPVIVGYWCYKIFARKGRSPGAGFAVGFIPTFFFSVIGGVIVVVVCYLLPVKPNVVGPAPHGPGFYPPPPPPSS
jgi:hypothetical protein